jgi:hypothetical protein
MQSSSLPVNICQVREANGLKAYVTLSLPDDVMKYGLITEEIVGQLINSSVSDEAIKPENFARNPAFVTFLHGIISTYGHSIPALVSAAKKQFQGLVVVLDGRTPNPQGAVPPEDILGCFNVSGGEIVLGSYQTNPNHRILTQHGFFQIESILQEKLLLELERLRLTPHSSGTA